VTYAALFEQYLGVDIHACEISELADLGRRHCDFRGELDTDGWLNLLFSHCIEPQLLEPTMVYAFPASQAALARVVEGDDRVPSAARFELFIKGMELANGYFELTDAGEQARRFAADQQLRETYRRPSLPIDQRLIAALQQGLPECAGVALGIDRLVMLALDAHSIDEVIAFPLGRA
jgi:lysyl-tRNA synthetase class 2